MFKTKTQPTSPVEEGILNQRLKKEEILKDKVAAGEWETLSLVEAFWERSPTGQLVAIQEAINNRISQLRRILPRLLTQDYNAAYIQILNYIHFLEEKRDNFTADFFAKLGKRQIDSESKEK